MPAVPKQPPKNSLRSRARRDMVEASGRFFQLLSLPRSTGQIYGLLYLSTKPLSLDDIVEQLSISKGSASLGTRQLAGWGAVRSVWVQGDRRDYFECNPEIRAVLRGAYKELVKPRIDETGLRLDRMRRDLEADAQEGLLDADEHKFCAERLDRLGRAQKEIHGLLPFAEKLL